MYIVMTRTDQPVRNARTGVSNTSYRKVAIVEIDGSRDPYEIRMISPRAKGVKRVIKVWDRLYAGRTERCAYRQALAKAEAMADELNRKASADAV